MTKILLNNRVSICNKDNCITAYGKNADLIAVGAFTMLLMFGVAALINTK